MTPDPDRLPIWILIVAVSSLKGSFVIAKKPEEVVVGWAMVVFQKRIPVLISLYARLRPMRKMTGEKVEKRIAMIRMLNLESCLLFARESGSYLEGR